MRYAVGVACGLALSVGLARAENHAPAPPSWGDVAAELVEQRTLAESCAATVQQFAGAGSAVRFRSERSYNKGRAAAEKLITGLSIELQGNTTPDAETLPEALRAVSAHRLEVCEEVEAIYPGGEGSKGILGDILKEIAGPLLEAFITREDLTREREIAVVLAELERARWPAFVEVQ